MYWGYTCSDNETRHALCDKEGNIINTAWAVLLILPGLYVPNHLTLIYFYDMS